MHKLSSILASFKRSEDMTTQEYIYLRLRKSILLGLIPPGDPVTIRGLAEMLDTSPTPVREALRRLSSEHALKLLPNRRIVVPQMTPDRFKELILLRVTLEVHASRAALPFVTDRLVQSLVTLDQKIDRAIESENRDQQITLNQEFHKAIYCANPEQVVVPMIESVWLQLGPFNRIAARNIKQLYIVDRHQDILKALRERDAGALAQAIDADIKSAVGHLHPDALDTILG